MRVDLALKYLCLVKSRSIAKTLCDKHLVLVNDKPVRPSSRVGEGCRISIRYRKRTLAIELLTVPGKQLSKTAAVDYYRRVEADPFTGKGDEDDWDLEILDPDTG
jgi:ribosomal 50S subunit-recycling heat shock protein